MSNKSKIRFVDKNAQMQAPDVNRCATCRNLIVTADAPRMVKVFDEYGKLLTGPKPDKDTKPLVFEVARCRVDTVIRLVDGKPAPFWDHNTPIRTCREMQLDECRGGKLYEGLH